jgi:prenyltransferase beta subunit
MNRTIASLIVCFIVVPILSAQTPEQKKATIKYLQELQCPDGGFHPQSVDSRLDQIPRGSLRATSSALRALKYFGGALKDKTAAEKFVTGCYDAEAGAFADSPNGKPDVFTTAVGLMAIAELKTGNEEMREKGVKYLAENAKEFEDVRIAAAGMESAGKLAPQVEQWRKNLLSKANADGSFGKDLERARATGGTIVTILRLGDKVENPAKVVELLNAGQNKDGAFGKDDTGASDLETSYRVMRCYHMLKAKPAKADSLRDYVAKCRNDDGGYGVQPGKPSNVGGTYFAGIILHWLSE